jgi:hypothetical protein
MDQVSYRENCNSCLFRLFLKRDLLEIPGGYFFQTELEEETFT